MRAVWSRKQPLASSGAVLGLLDGPHGCDPSFCIVWFQFRLFRRYLSLRPDEVPIHALVTSAHRIGFSWDSLMTRWDRPWLHGLGNLAGPIQHFRSAILDAGRNKVAADLCARRSFRGGPLLDISGSHQLLNSSHVRERDKALLRSVMSVVFGMVSCLERFVVRLFLVVFVVLLMVMATCFGNVLTLLMLRFAKILSFTIS